MRGLLQQGIQGRRGFSLIEQVVAIASVAVVAAVVVPTVVNQLDKSEISRITTDLRTIEKSAKDFRTDVSYWPGALLQLKDPIGTGSVDAFNTPILSTVFSDWRGPYFEPKAFVDIDPSVATDTRLTSAAGTYFTNALTTDSLAATGSTKKDTYLLIKLENVSKEDAEKISQSIDGEAALAAGRVQWTAGASGKGTLTYFAGPVN